MLNVDWLRSYGLVVPLGLIFPWLPRECGQHPVGGVPGSGSGGAPTTSVEKCALRVNPNASQSGSGQSWQDPMRDLQAAIDEQAQNGGGEVWVVGGEFPSLETAGGTLINLPSHIILRGGFVGTETTPEERPTYAPPTTLRSVAEDGVDSTLLQISGQSDVSVERLKLVDGSTPFIIEGSQRVHVSDVDIKSPAAGGTGAPQILLSDVRFEHVGFDLWNSFPAIQISDSSVAFVDSEIASYYVPVELTNSRLLLQRVAMDAPLMGDADTSALIIDSSLNEPTETGGVAQLAGHSALVGSRVTRGGATSALNAGSLLVFDSSFIGIHSTLAHGHYPQAAAIDAVDLRLSASTFYDYDCASFQGCDAAVRAGSIDNTLFARQAPLVPQGETRTPEQSAVLIGELAPNNCVSWDLSKFKVVETGDALALTHPCVNGGDATELEISRQKLLTFAEAFLPAPFNADLSRYAAPDWWRSESVLVDRSVDSGAPDPGKHVPGSGS